MGLWLSVIAGCAFLVASHMLADAECKAVGWSGSKLNVWNERTMCVWLSPYGHGVSMTAPLDMLQEGWDFRLFSSKWEEVKKPKVKWGERF